MKLARKEPFKYLPLNLLEQLVFAAPKTQDKAIAPQGHICFVDGQFVGGTLPDPIVVLPLSEAKKTYGMLLQTPFAEEKDPFARLALSRCQEGVLIYVPPNSVLDSPIQFKMQRHQAETLACPHVIVRVGKGARLRLAIEGAVGHHMMSYFDVAVEDNAELSIVNTMQTTDASWEFETVRANLKRDSQFKYYHLTDGGQCVRSDFHVKLSGENGSATLKGLARLKGENQAHQHILVEHIAEETHSDQHFKTVLHDRAQSSFEGKIYVHQEAQQTRAYQLNNNLLLGDAVVANSKPNLEIFADDVKASHGATMTRLNQEEKFYLTSRGLPAEAAEKLLESSFCADIIDEVLGVC